MLRNFTAVQRALSPPLTTCPPEDLSSQSQLPKLVYEDWLQPTCFCQETTTDTFCHLWAGRNASVGFLVDNKTMLRGNFEKQTSMLMLLTDCILGLFFFAQSSVLLDI